jgi:hypothetical protein
MSLNVLLAQVRRITFDPVNFFGLDALRPEPTLLTRRQWEVWVRTLYKRKDRKVLPANVPLPDGINP